MNLQSEVIEFRNSIQRKYPNAKTEIPFIIRLLENPGSPLALPGATTLYDHDCIHVLLKQNTSLRGEAFVIGFCMGNSSKIARVHVLIYKSIAKSIYPRKYRFSKPHLVEYDRGFNYGASQQIRDIHSLNFKQYHFYSSNFIRKLLKLTL